jgi:hypothetical protein
LALADQADRQGVFAHGLKSDHKRLQVSDLPRHKKLKPVLASRSWQKSIRRSYTIFARASAANIAPKIDIR